MRTHNFIEKIPLYRGTNPNLTDKEVGILLLIDNLYLEIPSEIQKFRDIYSHFDPDILSNGHKGITFLDIVDEHMNKEQTLKRLNTYFNIKFNHLGQYKSYEENMIKFKQYSQMVSQVIDNLLRKAKFPKEIIEILQEKQELRDCFDAYELFTLYKNTEDIRLRFETLRKIGLIVLLARISRSFVQSEVDFSYKKVKELFTKNLIQRTSGAVKYYYWTTADHKLQATTDENIAKQMYEKDVDNRKKLASRVYDVKVFEKEKNVTFHQNTILDFQIRNKFKSNGVLDYTSFVEKMLRKNLQFPNQVHDVIGIKIITETAEDIPKLIDELETFLGGASTRKKEKNTLNKFDKKQLNKYSAKDYYVWKAIYDVALPHPSIQKVERMIKLTKGNQKAQKELKERFEYFTNNPKDFVVEVQIQDINSYLLGISEGSIPHHDNLKMTQIKENTYYKLFPMKVYKKDLWELKEKILKGKD